MPELAPVTRAFCPRKTCWTVHVGITTSGSVWLCGDVAMRCSPSVLPGITAIPWWLLLDSRVGDVAVELVTFTLLHAFQRIHEVYQRNWYTTPRRYFRQPRVDLLPSLLRAHTRLPHREQMGLPQVQGASVYTLVNGR